MPTGSLLDQLDAIEGRAPSRHGGGSLLDQLDSLGELPPAAAPAAAADEDNRGYLSRALDAVINAPEFVRAGAKSVADWLDPQRAIPFLSAPAQEAQAWETIQEAARRQPTPILSVGGAVELAGEQITPLNVATLGTAPLLGAGAKLAGATAGTLGKIARAGETINRVGSGAIAARGGLRLAEAETGQDVAVGALETLLGGLGARGRVHPAVPEPTPIPSSRRLGTGARHVLDTLPAGAPEPLALPPGRGARFEAGPAGDVRPLERPQLPPGIIDEPIVEAEILTGNRLPPGTIHVDARGTAALPGDVGILDDLAAREAARDATIGQRRLPPGPRFVARPGGEVAAMDQPGRRLDKFVDEANVPPPDPSGGRSVRPAVIERDIDPHAPAKEGVTVRQYSSDPAAVDAPAVSDEERAVLEQFRADLTDMAPQSGRLLREGTYAHGARGAPILEQLRILSGQKVDQSEFVQAIDDLLAGKPPTNRMQTAAIDSARGAIEGRQSYVKPMTASLEAAPVEAADEGFDAFSSAVDELAGGADELVGAGESGFATTPFMLHAAGGVGGAAIGGATGEDTEDRLKRALIFGAMGAAAPSLLKRSGPAPGVVAGEPEVVGRGKVPRVAAMGAPNRQPMKDTEAFLGKFAPEVRAGITERLEANAGYAGQRRGVIGQERLAAIANQIGVDVKNATPKGTTASAEVITAYTRAVRQTQEKVNALTQKVRAGTASDKEIVALEAAKLDAAVALQSVMGMRTEAGRSLAAFRFLDDILKGNSELIGESADKLRGEARKFADEFAAVGNDPLKQYEFLKGKTTARTFSDQLRGYYYANILSGPKTHARNITGNVASILSNTAAQPFAAAIDAARSAITGAPRTVRFSEMPHAAVGAAAGMEEGIREFLYTMKHGISQRGLSQSISQAEKGMLDLPRVEFAGGGKNPFNWPGRTLDATDQFFRSVARQSELYSAAYSAARSEGHTGQKLIDRMAELRTGGGETGQKLREAAERAAARQVFQQESGPITQWLAQGYSKPYVGKAMMFTMPFLRTPANIIREGFQYTPGGFASKAAKAGGREGAQAMGKATAGTAALGGLAWLASTGRLSGNGPSDAGERARLMETGWRPNSVKIGDQWVSYQLMQPIAVPASLIANGFEAWAEKDGTEQGAIDTALSVASRAGNSFVDQSFLSGVYDLFEALKDPDRSASRVAGRVAQGLIPFVGAVRSTRDLTDPVVRKPGGFEEEIQAGLPGLSQGIEPRLNTYGQPVTREGGPLRRALDPFNVSSAVTDPVAAELKRLGVNPTQLGDKLTYRDRKLELTNEESLALRQEQGAQMRAIIERVMRASSYARLTDEQRQKLLKSAMSAAREQVNTAAKVKVLRRERGTR